jgi:hypothetical protein
MILCPVAANNSSASWLLIGPVMNLFTFVTNLARKDIVYIYRLTLMTLFKVSNAHS